MKPVRKRRVAAASGIGGGEAVRAEWATMVANNATSAAAKFSVLALWLCQWFGRQHHGRLSCRCYHE